MAIIFDGKQAARQREAQLALKVQARKREGVTPHIRVWVFREDEGSLLYTKLKKAAAERLRIIYEPIEHSVHDSLTSIVDEIKAASSDPTITGVMVQKPSKNTWNEEGWWEALTTAIDPLKDVDCLTTTNLGRLDTFIPATVRACLSILDTAQEALHVPDDLWQQKSVVVIGRSAIVGTPLAKILQNRFDSVRLIGKKELEEQPHLNEDVVIVAVGKPNLIKGEMVNDGVIVIDVGAPQGDVERASVEPKAAFLTPVPGGVGPMTVVSLMENAVIHSQE